ncbi:ELMO domain-containing protein 2 [Apophysomyces sp. BC1034]|nr:ELMO domain-containing protein 2 [Apophysomyces sp. BC1015]KAG0182646.1 ELMO domain-containing protein 2 [Apophysomyces sp. BC1021]KAG0191696.1 ELMO domain-containing protein 2 [Apophysomyces sp. BC1034]
MDWFILLVLNKIYQSPLFLSFYKVYKLVIRLTTGTTEIYRVCQAAARQLEQTHPNKEEDNRPLLDNWAERIPEDVVYRIDRSILYSKQLTLERRELESSTCRIDELIRVIITKKRFPGASNSPAVQVLRICLVRITETYRLTREINERAHTKYDSTNPLHEQKLLKLWKALMPETELEARLTRQWGEIGFQGNDPATDFRGMGIQGLDDLLYYAQTHPSSALRTFTSSRHPVSWYPYAIVGINITQYAVQALRTRQLQHFLFKFGTNRKTYNEFYCYLYHQFNEFWMSHEEPRLTVMDFEHRFKEFKRRINKELLVQDAVPLSILLQRTNPGYQAQSAELETKEAPAIAATSPFSDTVKQRRSVY